MAELDLSALRTLSYGASPMPLAGTPIHGCGIEVRDPATGEPVPTGEPGEIWVRSAQLMAGYWQRPEATEAAITADGRLRSGDGGHLDADGYVYVTDRVKDMIIGGGGERVPGRDRTGAGRVPGDRGRRGDRGAGRAVG